MKYIDLKIEKATDGDCGQVARLYDELNDYLDAHTNYPGWKKGIYPTMEDARAGLAEGCLYVARLSGRIAGTFMLRHRPEPGYALANWNSELDYSQILVLYTFAVHPDFLGLGLGKRMMDFITDLAVKAGNKAIRLDVYRNNAPAIALYEKCGFEYVDTVDLGYGEYGLDLYRLYQKLLPQAGLNRMGKKLDEMTLEELWQLFPIFLRSHDPSWSRWYDEERELLAAALPGALIHHIGSTAVPGIWAKPIVDILAEVDSGGFSCAHSAILACGYRCMCVEPSRRDYNKGYTEAGFEERVFHLHLRVTGDKDELYFRDYLLAHPDIAKEYEELKLSLWKIYEHDRDGYTNAKGSFISRHTQAAKGKKD